MLSQLEARDHVRVAALLAPSSPNLAFAHAALDGAIPGQVWAEWEGPRARACLITTGSPFCFLAGDMSPPALEQAFALLKERPPITLVAPPALEAAAVARGFAATPRHHYAAATEPLQVELPAGYRVAPIEPARFSEVLWKEMVAAIFGSADRYFAHHYGFFALYEDRIVAEIHGVVGGGLVECGAFAHPEHRRRGITTALVRQIHAHAHRLGHRAVATCVAGKTESERPMRNGGMDFTLAYRAFTLAR